MGGLGRLPREHRRGTSSVARRAVGWPVGSCVLVSWVSTALTVLGLVSGANSCPEAPSVSAAIATTVVTAAVIRYRRLPSASM